MLRLPQPWVRSRIRKPLPELRQAVDEDDSPKVTAAAGEALDSFELPQLAEASLESDDAEVRAAAAVLLEEQGLAEGAGPLIDGLSDPEASARDAASGGLQDLGPIAPWRTARVYRRFPTARPSFRAPPYNKLRSFPACRFLRWKGQPASIFFAPSWETFMTTAPGFL